MYVVFFLIIFSVFVRRFLPAKGLLLDKEIEQLTFFGNSRKIELRNLTGYNAEDLVTIASQPAQIRTNVQNQAVQPIATSTVTRTEGVDLGDIKGKTYQEVNTDYMYGNMDASDESLADALRKGGLK